MLYFVVDDMSDFCKQKYTQGDEAPLEQAGPRGTPGETWGADTEVPDQPEGVRPAGTDPSLEPTGGVPA